MISSDDESICQNGGTQFNIHSSMYPGGLIGKYCKRLGKIHKSHNSLIDS